MVLSSQTNEVTKWYFGNGAALDFSTNPPTSIANGSLSTWEGCSSIADASGNLLFYTNGVKVWNRWHLVMANGNGLAGENSSSQSALIVRQPGSSDIYFIFTTDGGFNGLCYSVVDMSLAAGMGSVTTKNIPLQLPSTERLCGTKHCNGQDIWVISHDHYSDAFRANLVTSSGVNTVAVISNVGTALYGTNKIGCMKVSPNGKKIGMALYRPPFSFELYDFNAATGVVSNALNLPVSAPAYGCEFSPDGTKFYGVLWAASSVTKRLRQWDLCSGTNASIVASETAFEDTQTGQLQLGPDGKIYHARAVYSTLKLSPELSVELMTGEPMLGVIHNPNAGASALNYNYNSVSLAPAKSMFGLPNFISGFYQTPVAQFTYSYNPPNSCVKAFFSAPPLVNNSCSATSYTVSSLQWIFGDPASGAANTSSALNPQHTYPAIGKYLVKLVLFNSCGGVIDTLRQQVIIGGAFLNKLSEFSICKGQSLTLVASATSTLYSWSTGATSNSITVSPQVNTTYTLSFTDAYGCPRQSIETITVNPTPTLTVLGKDTMCAGAVFTLTAKGAMTYSWSFGSTSPLIKVSPTVTTAYTLTGTSFEGCSTTKVVNAVVKPAPVPVVLGSTLSCAGYPSTLTALGSAQFLWNTGIQGPTFTVIPTEDQYIFSVKATYPNGCSRYNNKIKFVIKPLPRLAVAGPATLCAGQSIPYTASGALSYTWSNGATINPVILSPFTDSYYTLAGADSNNCVNLVSFNIKVRPSTVRTASVSPGGTICQGQNIFLSASGGNFFEWSPAVNPADQVNNFVSVSPTVSTIYSVNVSNDQVCGTTKTVAVHVKPKPKLTAGRDTIFNLKEPMFISATGTGIITWISGDEVACAVCPTTQIFPVQKTCYVAQSIGDNGCVAFDEVCIEVGQQYAVYVPSSFTPDGDGLNDEFYLSGFGVSNLQISIYNRLGEKLFSGDGQAETWDGSFNGKLCQNGTYVWVLDYMTAGGSRQQKTGSVTLLRIK